MIDNIFNENFQVKFEGECDLCKPTSYEEGDCEAKEEERSVSRIGCINNPGCEVYIKYMMLKKKIK